MEHGRQYVLASLATEIDHTGKSRFLPQIVELRNNRERLL
jgi:hypothetical protein